MRILTSKITFKDAVSSILSLLFVALFVWWGMHFPGPVPPSAKADPTPPPLECPSPSPTATVTPLASITPTPPLTCPNPSLTPYPSPAATIPSQYQNPNTTTQLSWIVFPVLYGNPPPPTPTPGPAKPGVLLIHGGNWNSGSAMAVVGEGNQISSAGYFTVAVNYQLCPPNYIPGQPCHENDQTTTGWRVTQLTNDIKTFVRALRADSRCNGKVGIVGGSAGANLAVWVALDTNPSGNDGDDWPYWFKDGNDDRPDCAAMLSCIYDFSDWTPPTGGLVPDQDYVRLGMQNFVQTLSRTDLKTWSPVSLVASAYNSTFGFKPLFMINSYGDHPTAYHQLVSMFCTLEDVGVPESDYQTLTIAGSDHSFAYWGTLDPATNQTVGQDVIDFLDARLK